jgi:hypothetical protein
MAVCSRPQPPAPPPIRVVRDTASDAVVAAGLLFAGFLIALIFTL